MTRIVDPPAMIRLLRTNRLNIGSVRNRVYEPRSMEAGIWRWTPAFGSTDASTIHSERHHAEDRQERQEQVDERQRTGSAGADAPSRSATGASIDRTATSDLRPQQADVDQADARARRRA